MIAMKKVRELFGRVVFLLSVPRCVCCGAKLLYTEHALCRRCMEQYENSKERNCSRCAKRLDNCSCTSAYLRSKRVRKHAKIFRYSYKKKESPQNRLIYALKDANRADVFDLLADELCGAINNTLAEEIKKAGDSLIITNVPRRPLAIRRAGYDHAQQLAKRVAKRLNVRYVSLLKSKARKPQKGMVGEQRRANARFAYKCGVKRKIGDAKCVMIIDDVVTSGASVCACAEMLRPLGVKRAYCASIAAAYKDMYVPPITSWF